MFFPLTHSAVSGLLVPLFLVAAGVCNGIVHQIMSVNKYIKSSTKKYSTDFYSVPITVAEQLIMW